MKVEGDKPLGCKRGRGWKLIDELLQCPYCKTFAQYQHVPSKEELALIFIAIKKILISDESSSEKIEKIKAVLK